MASMILYRVRTWSRGRLSRTEFLHRKDAVTERIRQADFLARHTWKRQLDEVGANDWGRDWDWSEHIVLVDQVSVDDVVWEPFDG